MTLSSTPFDIVLARGEILSLDGAEGARITSLGGTVWITQDGDLRDIVLREGEAFELDRPTPAIVQAFEPARVAISEPALRPVAGGVASWGRQLRAAIRRRAMRPAWA